MLIPVSLRRYWCAFLKPRDHFTPPGGRFNVKMPHSETEMSLAAVKVVKMMSSGAACDDYFGELTFLYWNRPLNWACCFICKLMLLHQVLAIERECINGISSHWQCPCTVWSKNCGMYFVGSNCDLYSVSITAVTCAISSYTWPRNNGTWLYSAKFIEK